MKGFKNSQSRGSRKYCVQPTVSMAWKQGSLAGTIGALETQERSFDT